MNDKKTKLKDEKALQSFAESFAGNLSGGEVILLSGVLGVGKTTFVKALARSLGANDIVSSPTFVLRNEYSFGANTLLHIDLYRLSEARTEDMEFLESVGDSDTVTCIEWPSRISNIEALPGKKIRLEFEITGAESRTIIQS